MNSPPNAIDNQPVLPVDVDLYADLPAFPPQWPGASTYQTMSVPSLGSQITQPPLTLATPTPIPPGPTQGMSTLPYTGPSMMSSSTCTTDSTHTFHNIGPRVPQPSGSTAPQPNGTIVLTAEEYKSLKDLKERPRSDEIQNNIVEIQNIQLEALLDMKRQMDSRNKSLEPIIPKERLAQQFPESIGLGFTHSEILQNIPLHRDIESRSKNFAVSKDKQWEQRLIAMNNIYLESS